MSAIRQVAAAALVGTSLTGAATAAFNDGRAIPAVTLQAYVNASAASSCHVDWRDLAAIRQLESPGSLDHTAPDGRTTQPDGSPVRGDFDLGTPSKGPFQFRDPTWQVYGQGDPDNLNDAAAATARMLCANDWATDRRSAIRRHNGSGPRAEAYADAALELAAQLPVEMVPMGTVRPGSDSHEGVTLRITDALIERALDGWAVLNGRAQAHAGEAPTLAAFFRKADEIQLRLTSGGGGADGYESATSPLGVASTDGLRIVEAARRWVGREFNPGVPAQCAVFVREVLAEAGIDPGVSQDPVDGYAPTYPAVANSFGRDNGELIPRDQLRPGDLVLLRNTYGTWARGSITHVAIYAGGGQIIDRSTLDAPIRERDMDATFPGLFVTGVRVTARGRTL